MTGVLLAVVVGAALLAWWARRAADQSRVERDIVGPRWTLTEVIAGERRAIVHPSNGISLELRTDGIATSTDCSSDTGHWEATAEGFRIVDATNNLIACGYVKPPPPLPDYVHDAVNQVSTRSVTARRADNRLILDTGDYVLSYREQP
ncbi:hypothetical protein [Nakamurella endophytica]|uniref:META domain-containing protein n=1 Tax=Nakamurella endophytica TaxID=1748367 RepID=A0A917T5M0_9ACTN|nr:hypothetical protein [Nakamurella endophytica]GGM10300.1 hypothetical protein GCM10011594_32760 [Nakamurella endophytica]